MISEIAWDWDKVGTFIQTVGVPFTCLLLFAAPFIYLLFSLVKQYGPKIAQSHISFVESSIKIQEQNAQTLSKLERSMAASSFGHNVTHQAIHRLTTAGIHIIDGDRESARKELGKVDGIFEAARERTEG